MNANQIVARVIEALDRLQIPYMLVGSFSSNAFGVARSTNDADFVIELGERSAGPLFDGLRDVLTFDPQMRIETVTGTLRWVGKSADSAFNVELFLVSHDPHDRERFRRRERHPFVATSAWLPTKEDVLIQKLRWYARARRPKDWEDVISVLEAQGSAIDTVYLEQWCQTHGTVAFLHEALREIQQPGQE